MAGLPPGVIQLNGGGHPHPPPAHGRYSAPPVINQAPFPSGDQFRGRGPPTIPPHVPAAPPAVVARRGDYYSDNQIRDVRVHRSSRRNEDRYHSPASPRRYHSPAGRGRYASPSSTRRYRSPTRYLQIANTRGTRRVLDRRSENLTEAGARERLSSIIPVRLERHPNDNEIDGLGNPLQPTWEKVVMSEQSDISKQEAARQVRRLQLEDHFCNTTLVQKKNDLGPRVQDALEYAKEELERDEPDSRFGFVLAQFESVIKKVKIPEMPQRFVEHHKKERSRDRHGKKYKSKDKKSSKYKKEKYYRDIKVPKEKRRSERTSVTAYFRRAPRDGENCLKMFREEEIELVEFREIDMFPDSRQRRRQSSARRSDDWSEWEPEHSPVRQLPPVLMPPPQSRTQGPNMFRPQDANNFHQQPPNMTQAVGQTQYHPGPAQGPLMQPGFNTQHQAFNQQPLGPGMPPVTNPQFDRNQFPQGPGMHQAFGQGPVQGQHQGAAMGPLYQGVPARPAQPVPPFPGQRIPPPPGQTQPIKVGQSIPPPPGQARNLNIPPPPGQHRPANVGRTGPVPPAGQRIPPPPAHSAANARQPVIRQGVATRNPTVPIRSVPVGRVSTAPGQGRKSPAYRGTHGRRDSSASYSGGSSDDDSNWDSESAYSTPGSSVGSVSRGRARKRSHERADKSGDYQAKDFGVNVRPNRQHLRPNVNFPDSRGHVGIPPPPLRTARVVPPHFTGAHDGLDPRVVHTRTSMRIRTPDLNEDLRDVHSRMDRIHISNNPSSFHRDHDLGNRPYEGTREGVRYVRGERTEMTGGRSGYAGDYSANLPSENARRQLQTTERTVRVDPTHRQSYRHSTYDDESWRR